MAQPVRILFLPEGVERVAEAFRTVEQAARRSQSSVTANLGKQRSAAQATAQAVVSSSDKAEKAKTSALEKEAQKREQAEKRSVDRRVAYERKVRLKAIEDQSKAEQKAADAAKRAAEKLARDRAAGKTGIEGLSKKEAVSMIFGSSSAGMASLGGIGVAVGGAIALKGALSLAAHALTQFGGFVINEVLRPAMAAKKGAQQMANRGAGSSAAILADARALNIAHGGGVDRAQAALDAAYETTRDYGTAKEVAGMSLSASRAYGIQDTESLTNHLAKMRTQLGGMSESEFKSFADVMIGQSKGKGLSLNRQAALGDSTLELAADFVSSNANQKARNIAGIQGIVGMSALSTGDPAKAMAGFTSLVTEAQRLKVGVDPGTNRIKDVNALLPTFLSKFGNSELRMRAGGVDEGTIKFLRPFMEMQKNGTLVGAIAAAGTDAKAAAGVAGKDEKSLAQSTQERFDAAVEKFKEKLVTLVPALEHVMDTLVANAPAFEALIDNAIIPLGVALGDLAAFTVNNLNPMGEMLSGLFDMLAGAVRVAILPFTIIPAVLAKFVSLVINAIPASLQTEGMRSIAAGADKVASSLTVGGFEQMFGGADKIAKGLANVHADEGARAVPNPFSSTYHHGAAPPVNPMAGAPSGVGWVYTPTAATPAAPASNVTLDPKSINALANAITGKTTASNAGRNTPMSDPFRVVL